MNHQFKVGDRVISKGNSQPQMTIKSIENGLCNCEWNDKDKKEHKESFDQARLEKV